MAARGTEIWRRTTWGEPCVWERMGRVELVPGVAVTADRRAAPALQELGRVLQRHGYEVRQDDTGAYNCRKTTGGRSMSSHAWGTAVDINWRTNPYGRELVTDMPSAMIDEILAIRTRSGARVFRWGGHFSRNKDAMHFELVATPDELATGIENPTPEPGDTAVLPLLRRGSRGTAVARVQRILGVLGPDRFGPLTEAAVRRFQQQHGLTVDGIVGPNTWAKLLEHDRPAP